MNKTRLDQRLVSLGLATNRSNADSFIRMGKVSVNGTPARKSGQLVFYEDKIKLAVNEHYVSRAGYKLASVASVLNIKFNDKVVLDVGSSTGGFTDYALQHGAKKVFAVDVGTEQLDPRLRSDQRIELHEKTDIRSFAPSARPDVVVIDVSFVSLREILPHVANIVGSNTQIVAMVKPQFEAGREQVAKGIIKNDRIRRDILKDFELWAKRYFVIVGKADSEVAGSRGNKERFYVLKKQK